MTAVSSLLHAAEAAGIRLRLAPDGVRALLPAGKDVGDLLAQLRAHRDEVRMALEAQRQPVAPPAPAHGFRPCPQHPAEHCACRLSGECGLRCKCGLCSSWRAASRWRQ